MKWTAAVVVFAATKASAEPAIDPARSPGFVLLDRFDANTSAGVEASNLHFSPALYENESEWRFDLYGWDVDPKTNVGVYAQAPASRHQEFIGSLHPWVWAIGDLDVGGLYVLRPEVASLAIVLRAGVTLPTGSTSSPEFDRAGSNHVAAYARVNDVVLAIPRGVSVRTAASALGRSGRLFARGDLGFDLNLLHDDTSVGPPDWVFRIDLAAGFDLGFAAVSIESSNVYIEASGSDARIRNFNSGAIDTEAIAVRFAAGVVRPYAAYIARVNGRTQSIDLTDAVTVGVAGVLP